MDAPNAPSALAPDAVGRMAEAKKLAHLLMARHRHTIEAIYLYGSTVRACGHPDDIDMIVVASWWLFRRFNSAVARLDRYATTSQERLVTLFSLGVSVLEVSDATGIAEGLIDRVIDIRVRKSGWHSRVLARRRMGDLDWEWDAANEVRRYCKHCCNFVPI